MKKTIYFIFVFCFFVLSFSVLSFAVNQPSTINTPLSMPSLYVNDDGVYTTYQIAQSAYYPDGRAELCISSGKFLTGATLTYRAVDYNYTYIMGTTQSVEGHFETYDLFTGSLVNYGSCYLWAGSGSDYRIAINGTMSGFPAGYNVAQYCYLPEQITRSNYKYNVVEPFINFSVVPPEPKVYQSYMSEPVQDPLNKYVILAGDEGSYLYWINIRCREFEEFVTAFDFTSNGVYTEIVKAESLFTPTLKFIESGQSILSIECNQTLLDWYKIFNVNSAIYDWKLEFQCLITKYDLETGEYIDSTFNSNCVLQSQYIDIDATSFFGHCSDYDSIAVYGLNYYNQSSYLLNRLACNWGINPSFETWKNSVLSVLNGIYNALVSESETFETDTALSNAVNDYSNAEASVMPSGDQAGNQIDAALNDSGADNVLSGNGAYGFIRDTINSIIFENSKITAFVIFALGMGIVVLVLGRRIHV